MLLRSWVVLAVCSCVWAKCNDVVCKIYCEFGNVVDENGCRTCRCQTPPVVVYDYQETYTGNSGDSYRFSTAFSKKHRLFTASSFEDCKEQCSSTNTCKGVYEIFSTQVYKCHGLDDVGHRAKTGQNSSSHTKVVVGSNPVSQITYRLTQSGSAGGGDGSFRHSTAFNKSKHLFVSPSPAECVKQCTASKDCVGMFVKTTTGKCFGLSGVGSPVKTKVASQSLVKVMPYVAMLHAGPDYDEGWRFEHAFSKEYRLFTKSSMEKCREKCNVKPNCKGIFELVKKKKCHGLSEIGGKVRTNSMSVSHLKSACAASPCLNGGTCSDTPVGYRFRFSCKCPPGYYGSTCGDIISGCRDSPCRNGGTCYQSLYYGYTCDCRRGFTGRFCESGTAYSACASTPCKNGGTCRDTPVGGYTCD